MNTSKYYVVQRKRIKDLPPTVDCVVVTQDGQRQLKHDGHHSPYGFAFGYGGSGPSDLARAIVADFTGEKDPDPRLYQEFKWAWVARLQGDGPHILSDSKLESIIGEQVR